ncbi:MAG: hypothetical protein PHR92_16375 [Lachnospiraceae bacterium]|nr:hypothetical protein [Lachnospiraceae bacterium]
MAPKQKTPYKREPMVRNKLEVDMLEYQLTEARNELDVVKKQRDFFQDKSTNLENVADLQYKKVEHANAVSATLAKRLTNWKVLAIVEGMVIIGLLFILGVG